MTQLLVFYILAPSKIISGWVLTRVSVHSRWLYSAATLMHQAADTMIQHPTQSEYPDPEITNPCPIILIPSSRLGSDTSQFYKPLAWLDLELNSRSVACEACAVPIQPLRPVHKHEDSCSLYIKEEKLQNNSHNKLRYIQFNSLHQEYQFIECYSASIKNPKKSLSSAVIKTTPDEVC